MRKGMILLLLIFLPVGPYPAYGGIKEVCDLQKVADGLRVITPDVKRYLKRMFSSPCGLLKAGEKEAAMRQLKALIPLVESYVGREITREEADRVIRYIEESMVGL